MTEHIMRGIIEINQADNLEGLISVLQDIFNDDGDRAKVSDFTINAGTLTLTFESEE